MADTEPLRSSRLPAGPIEIDGRTLQPTDPRALGIPPHFAVWVGRHLRVIASLDPGPHGELLHASISRRDRDPSWTEIRGLRAAIFPVDVDVAMVLPVEDDYINVHEHCFHLWEMPVRWGIR